MLNAVSFLSLFSCIRTKTLSKAPGPAEDYISQGSLHPMYHVTKLWPMICEKPHTATGPCLTRGDDCSSPPVPFFGNRSRLPEISTAETFNKYLSQLKHGSHIPRPLPAPPPGAEFENAASSSGHRARQKVIGAPFARFPRSGGRRHAPLPPLERVEASPRSGSSCPPPGPSAPCVLSSGAWVPLWFHMWLWRPSCTIWA